MNKQFSTLLLSLLFIGGITQAQVSHGGSPLPFTQTKSPGIFFEEMPFFDVEEEFRIDALNESNLKGGYRFAYKFMTHFNRNNAGTSFILPDGTFVWRLGIRSKNAYSINILFTEYELPDGAQVFLYDPAQTQVLGSFTSLNNSVLGILPVAPLHGDELIIEYHEPPNTSFPGKLTVGEVNHGYKNLRGDEPGNDRAEFYCMPPTVCSQDNGPYDQMARSTVLLIIDGTVSCSGVMINNTAHDGKPYLLTASHCLNRNFTISNPDYESVAGRIVCFFNYSSPTCKTVKRGTEEMSTASAIFRAVYEKNDLALLELIETPPVYYQPYYAGWNIEETGGKPPYTGIHHPMGSVKRRNTANGIKLNTFDPNIKDFFFTPNTHWHVEQWATGSTAGGSSGSPLFDAGYRVVGALSGGGSYCSSPRNDFYYALSKAWLPSAEENKQLKRWLDPGENNRSAIDGLDPYASNPCFRLSNIYDQKLQDSIEITKLASPGSGNLFGINTSGTNQYAEEYRINGRADLYGVYIVTPSIDDPAESLQVEIMVYGGEGAPQTLLHTEKFHPAYTNLATGNAFQETGKNLAREQESFVPFEKPVAVYGSFFIGYKISSPANSSFAVFNLSKGKTSRNTAWIYADNKWIKAGNHPSLFMNTSLFIDPVAQYVNADSNEDSPEENPVRVFLGTDKRTIHVLFSGEKPDGTCFLYTVNGALISKIPVSGNQMTVPVSGLNPGVYLFHIAGDRFSHTQKLIF